MEVVTIRGSTFSIVYRYCPPPSYLKSKKWSIAFITLKLSRNFGHQNALLAGLEYAAHKCDCAISIDCDLQQDENMFDEFIRKYQAGSDIVLGIRNDRHTDSLFKKQSANVFYDFMALMGTKVVKNHADYRLLSAKALQLLGAYKESNLFLRGVIMDMGLKIDRVYFDVKPRSMGESKYTLAKMCAFALNGITSFSVAPLRLVSVIGFVFFIAALLFLCYVLYVKFWTHDAIFGWASTAILLCFFSGIQLLSLGIIGEYIGKIYTESKRRPRYIIEDIKVYEGDSME
ncbi:glycosyltransferase [uncultured Helicobacter sp.]|uniref:glycosyltransferase n=2 Tax=uncultured Helicobacter sp. TaxID=175537 RepID=UPI00262335DC|nr:glycosyltransferase [uncultured Helicobacter sp.]